MYFFIQELRFHSIFQPIKNSEFGSWKCNIMKRINKIDIFIKIPLLSICLVYAYIPPIDQKQQSHIVLPRIEIRL